MLCTDYIIFAPRIKRTYMTTRSISLLMFFLSATNVLADELPTINPIMRVTGDEMVDQETTEYSGNAPMHATFEANPQNVGEYMPLYEWRFMHQNEDSPFLIRHDERTEYTFNQSGSFYVELRVSFILGKDTIEYVMDSPFAISIDESILEVPNAFTPNNDGTNDIFRIKQGWQSLVEFRAMVFNRWGKKLFEWTNPNEGWDGRSGGRDCPDGAYYLHLDAKGADGRKYHIRKTINLLRSFQENSGSIR